MRDVRLGVEIDNSRIVEVMPLAYGASGTMDLAAIERGQRRALVRLYVLRGSNRTELTTMDVRTLPAYPNRRALLRLRSTVDRAGELRLRLDVEDRLYHDERVDVRPYLRRSRTAVAAAALGLIVLLVAAAFLLLRGLPGGDTTAPVAEAPAAEAAPRDEPAAESESEAGVAEREQEPEGDTADADRDPQTADAGRDPQTGDAGATADRAATGEPEAPAEAETEPAPPEAVEPAEWSVYFPPDSPVLTARARTRLAEVAARLEDYPAEVTISITGHTALAGTERGRYDLSEQRARNVYRYLQTAGWDAAGEVLVRGVGGEAPVTRDPDRQELNRRAEIEVAP